MRPGWNPTRRNRNIGTAKQGHGHNNRLNIPHAWPDDRIFYEVLSHPIAITRTIQNQVITFLVEPTHPDYFYPCTVDDVAKILNFVPETHLEGLELIIFRQPTRKQSNQNPVWGRFLYYATPGKYAGTAICLEAQSLKQPLSWGRSLTPYDVKELDRLRTDGHLIHQTKRGYQITSTAISMRNTILFRTVLHELGHYIDWLQSVIWPTSELADQLEVERIEQAFTTKPSQMKEEFAHRYAIEQFTDLQRQGKLPFQPIFDRASMHRDQLQPGWFTANH
ncbi:hypothetical protein IQ266_06605 [filamentous cyanobacterium LEGE 11480]|uniref:Uncharacterized protein n=1 Tax=Romeriopsis navalis LEGE 11480 TaxID=2777977 RepID=A0A928Z3N9_9CYAN|nr:hypothetical protein [Romeriopsis navalis]MBE9029433.1 hypothetical protein [Romeriopsis navalis LEGE 11480]